MFDKFFKCFVRFCFILDQSCSKAYKSSSTTKRIIHSSDIVCLSRNTSLTFSMLRIHFFSVFRLVAWNIKIVIDKIAFLKKKKLWFTRIWHLQAQEFALGSLSWGRLLVFLSFVEQLELIKEEWELLSHFSFPLLLGNRHLSIMYVSKLQDKYFENKYSSSCHLRKLLRI